MGKKKQIDERALLARVNRALAKDGERVIRSRPIRGKFHYGKPVYPPEGRFYRVSGKERVMVARDVDLWELAKKFDLIKPWEDYVPVTPDGP
jgi:hypothetical protein